MELSLELKKIGTNLNQVVYQINREALLQGRATPGQVHLEEIRKMQRAVLSAADDVDKLFIRAGRRRLTSVDELLAKEDD